LVLDAVRRHAVEVDVRQRGYESFGALVVGDDNASAEVVSANERTIGGSAMSDQAPVASLSKSAQSVLSAINDEETLSLLRDLIRCRSENPPGEEEATARVLAAYLDRHGISHHFDEIAPGRPNLIATIGESDTRTVVFNGHTDTVPIGEGWTVDPLGAEIRDGRVFGRGACDMLAGVAAMSAAAVALKRSKVPLAGRLLIHAVIDEEVDAIGSQRAAADVEGDWVIVTEASAGRIEAYGKGQLNVEIAFQGKAAHSSTPEKGRNAIDDAAAFIRVLEQENERLADSPYPGVGPATFTAAIIHGGSHGSTVPAGCTLTLDRRVLPNETLDQAQLHVQRLLDEVRQARPGMDATMRPTLLSPPHQPIDDDPLVSAIQAATEQLGAGIPEISGAAGATDAAWYAARGIPTVVYGPGDGATAHEPDEFIAIDDLHLATRVLALSALQLLAPTNG
jgi:acetylornithine deacetylase/succinyl-diaminopimelate desuccinylase family protein